MKSELITVVEPLVSIPTLSKFTPDQQAVLDRLEMYPAATFYFPAWSVGARFGRQGFDSNHRKNVCFTCIAGWTASSLDGASPTPNDGQEMHSATHGYCGLAGRP